MHTLYRKKILSCFLIFLLLYPSMSLDNAAYVSANRQIKLNVQKTKTLKTGKSYQLRVKNLPKRAGQAGYKWTSSKKEVASISSKGRVKAKNAGTTKITCKINYRIKTGSRTTKKKKQLTCKIKVIQETALPSSSPDITTEPVTPTNSAVPAESAAPTTPVASPNSPDDGKDSNITPSPSPLPLLSEYVKDMGIGINLGNTMEAFWEDKGNKTSGAMTIGANKPSNYETCWGAVETTQEIIDGYKNAGFSTVRIPVYWGNMMKDDGTFVINKQYMERVEEIVEYCLNDNLYAVINIHHFDEFLIKNYKKDDVIQITEKLWAQIAEYFKDYSDHLIFEGFNENLGTQREEDNYSEDQIYDYVNEMNQTFVNAVRKTDANNAQRILIVSGYWTNIDKTTDSRFKMPADSTSDRLMVSVHYIDNAMYWSNKIGSTEWLEYSTKQCELLKKSFTEQGIPVFVGECTAIYDKERFASDALYTQSSECLRVIMDMAADYGFLPVIWDTNDNAYSRTNYCMKFKSDQKVITEIANKIKGTAP